MSSVVEGGRIREARAALIGSDLGLLRLRLAVRAVLAVAAIAAVEHLLGPAVGMPALVAMLVGGMVGMNGAFAASSRTRRDAALTLSAFPVVAGVAVLVAGLLDRHRLAALIGFVAVMVAAVFVRRYGARWFQLGMLAFISYFFATFTALPLSAFPSVIAVLAAAAAVLVVVALLVPDHPRWTLTRALHGFELRVAAVGHECAEALSGRTPARLASARLHGRTLRVAEAAVVIDGQLALAGPPDGEPPAALRRRLLQAQVVLEELGVAVGDLLASGRTPYPAGLIAALAALGRSDVPAAAALAGQLDTPVRAAGADPTVREAAEAILNLATLLRPRHTAPPTPEDAFEPAVELFLGNLPGSVASANAALAATGSRLSALSLNARQCVQVSVAGSLAIAAGDLLSPRRYYWAVLACFLALTGTVTAGEAAVKALNRVLGTVAGLAAAVVAVHVTGRHDSAVVAVMLACVFLGLYFFRVSYAVMAFAVTTLMGLLYNVLGEFSDRLLLLRLTETVLGGAIAMAVALVVLPVRTSAARSAAERAFRDELGTVLECVRQRLTGEPNGDDLLLVVRRLDASLLQLVLVSRPAGGPALLGVGRPAALRELSGYTALASRARRLATAAASASPEDVPALSAAADALERTLRSGDGGQGRRAAATAQVR